MKLIGQWNFYQYANFSDISADVANSNALISVMDFTDVPMLKIWPILADTDTDINIGASLPMIHYSYNVHYHITRYSKLVP